MIHINLLPWREQARKAKRQQFLTTLGLSVLAMAIVLFGWRMFVDARVDYQQSRNDFLRSEIAEIEKKLKEIEALDKTKASILARMEVIQNLQAGRPEAVHLMDELVDVVPSGVYLTQMKQSGRLVTLNGQAESNARVSALMRNTEASDWLEQPQLQIVQNKSADKAAGMNDFSLVVKQKRPKQAEVTEAQEQGVVQ